MLELMLIALSPSYVCTQLADARLTVTSLIILTQSFQHHLLVVFRSPLTTSDHLFKTTGLGFILSLIAHVNFY